MSEPIDFYFDFSSPYRYFAAHRIDPLAAAFGRETRWHPMLLGVALKESGNTPLIEQPMKGAYMAHDCPRVARLMDLPWRLPDPFPITSLAPARAFYWLSDRDGESAKAFAQSVFSAYFGDGLDISRAEAVADVGEGCGIRRDELLAAIQDPEIKDRLRAETADAIGCGVFGSPFFFVDREPFWGSDRLWMVERWLATGGW